MGEPKAQKLPFVLVQDGIQRIFFYQGQVLTEDEIRRVVSLARERNAYIRCKKRFGSGVRLNSELVITSWHIIREEGNEVFVDGQKSELLYYRKCYDMALLSVSKKNLPQVSFSEGRELDSVFWIAHPQDLKNLVCQTTIMGVSKRFLYIKDQIPCGCSGGGLYSYSGELLGIAGDRDIGTPKTGTVARVKKAWLIETFLRGRPSMFKLTG